ncbi:MAG: acyl-CoA carboxylase subunit epsilon [Nocardiopsaceae bacterium]|nr:acyl-CoA carboxylase subunit epsilon [Nocardiopsaceae bacterium]
MVATPPAPALRIIRGDATDEEVAAVVAALSAVTVAGQQAAGAGQSPRSVREWNAPSRLLRSPGHPSPGGWRRSALPT